MLYWANHSQIRWANLITAGQVLKVPAKPAKIPSAPAQLGRPRRRRGPTLRPLPRPRSRRPARRTRPRVDLELLGRHARRLVRPCVVARESGGNSQVMNSSGHYGLYQFSEATWVAYGGNPADFGNASVAEQNQVFANAIARAASPTGPPTTAADAP